MASAEEFGQFELKFSDNQEANPIPVYANATQVISGGAKASPTGEALKAIPKAFEGVTRPGVRTKGRILVYFTSNAGDTIESEESQWEIPIIVTDVDTGDIVTRKTLTQENMTGFTQAGTVDIVVVADVPQRIAFFEVPRGLAYGIDPNGKVRAYIGDDTA